MHGDEQLTFMQFDLPRARTDDHRDARAAAELQYGAVGQVPHAVDADGRGKLACQQLILRGLQQPPGSAQRCQAQPRQ